MARRVSNDCHTIGFNQQVDVGNRSYHVQTEVVGSKQLSVRTTVLEGGVVCDRFSQPLASDEYAAAQTAAEQQHRTVVDRVAHGGKE